MTKEELLQLWNHYIETGNAELAAEISADIDALEAPAVEEDVVTDEAALEAYREISPVPSVERQPESPRPPEDTTPSGEVFRAVEKVLYPNRSASWVEDAFVGGAERFVESEGEGLAKIGEELSETPYHRENWEMVGELGGWASTLLLAPGSGGTSLAAGPLLAASGAGIMATLYEEFMNQGQDLDEVPDVVRNALLFNTIATGLPTVGAAVSNTIARFITGVKVGSAPFRKRTQEMMRKAAEEGQWLNDVWQRYKMVGGHPDPSASGRSRFVTASKAFGRMYVVGRWYQKRAQENVKKSVDWFASELEKVAPVLDPETIGVRWAADAASMGRYMIGTIKSMYDDVFAAAAPIDEAFKKQGGVVPMRKLREYAETVQANVRRKLPETEEVVLDPITGKPKYTYDHETGNVIPQTEIKEMLNFSPDAWQKWIIRYWGSAREFTTMRQLKNMKDILSQALKKQKDNPDFDTTVLREGIVATQAAMKEAELYLRTLPADEYSYKIGAQTLKITPEQLSSRMGFANNTFKEIMDLLERPAAQRHHAIDRRFWEKAHLMGNYLEPGNAYADEMFTLAFKGNKLGYLRDLRMLVGDEAFNMARVRYLKDMADASFTRKGDELIFDAGKFRKLSGLDSNPRVMDELLKGTRLTRQKLNNFVKLLEDYETGFDLTAMQFRRGAIGGTKAIVGGLAPVAGFAAGAWANLPGAIIGVFLLRMGGKLFTSPWAFKQLSEFARAERNYYTGQLTKAKYLAAVDKAIRYFGWFGDEDAIQEGSFNAQEAEILKEQDIDFQATMDRLYPSAPGERTGPLYTTERP